ncbi:hypothetical protein HDV00_007583 [Rhizophlyctis rosea]|nr:hypothetical protein HDV00_007583 [Rhizophlyctis rosea]
MLVVATSKGFEDVTKVIFKANGGDFTSRSSALVLAAKGGHVGIVRSLFEVGELRGEQAEVALAEAAVAGHIQVMRTLLGSGLDKVLDYQSRAARPLAAAARADNVEAAKLLLEAVPHFTSNLDGALLQAACSGAVKVIRVLVEAGADLRGHLQHPNANINTSPLYRAAAENHLATVRELLRLGVDVNNPGFHQPMLFIAARHGNAEMFKFLLDAGADPHLGFPGVIWSLVKDSHVELLRILLQAHPTFLQDEKPHVLLVAAREGQAKVVEVLLKAYAGKYVDPEENGPAAALTLAAENGHVKVVERLLREDFGGKKGK